MPLVSSWGLRLSLSMKGVNLRTNEALIVLLEALRDDLAQSGRSGFPEVL